jgi:hypothetical protein
VIDLEESGATKRSEPIGSFSTSAGRLASAAFRYHWKWVLTCASTAVVETQEGKVTMDVVSS